MARRGKEQALQQELETQEEWEEMLSKEGLCGNYLPFLMHFIMNTRFSKLLEFHFSLVLLNIGSFIN